MQAPETGAIRAPSVRPLPRDVRLRAEHALREQRPTGPRWQGNHALTVRELQRAIGAGAWRLWTALLTLRDNEAITSATTRRLEAAAQLNAAGVKRALRRLREARLIEDVGFIYAIVPCHRCPDAHLPHHHEVYQRLVFGKLVAAKDALSPPSASVPEATVRWAAKSAGWGGKRTGAGRPKGAAENARCAPRRREIKMYPDNSTCTTDQNLRAFSRGKTTSFLMGKSAPSESAHESFSEAEAGMPVEGASLTSPPAPTQPKRVRVLAPPLTPVQEAVLVAAGRIAKVEPAPTPTSASEAPVSAPAAQPAPPQTRQPSDPDWTALPVQKELGFSGGGPRPKQQRLSSTDASALDSLWRKIPQTYMPSPQKFDQTDTPEQRLELLRRAWRAAHEKVTGRRYWEPRRGKPIPEAQRRKMLDCAAALFEAEISPTVWAVFSLRTWLDTMSKKGVPAQGWVWDASRVKRHARWCQDTTGPFERGTPVWTPAFRELRERMTRLGYALGRGRRTEEVLEEILPPARFAEIIAQAQAEQQEAQREIVKRIKAGEWMWG